MCRGVPARRREEEGTTFQVVVRPCTAAFAFLWIAGAKPIGGCDSSRTHLTDCLGQLANGSHFSVFSQEAQFPALLQAGFR